MLNDKTFPLCSNFKKPKMLILSVNMHAITIDYYILKLIKQCRYPAEAFILYLDEVYSPSWGKCLRDG